MPQKKQPIERRPIAITFQNMIAKLIRGDKKKIHANAQEIIDANAKKAYDRLMQNNKVIKMHFCICCDQIRDRC